MFSTISIKQQVLEAKIKIISVTACGPLSQFARSVVLQKTLQGGLCILKWFL